MSEEDRLSDIEPFLEYLRDARGSDFTGYRRASLTRRVRLRMERVGVASYDDYIDRLEVDPAEFNQLLDTVLINVTTFFRDPDAWECLRQDVLPRLVASRPQGPIRVWSAGCATGQEPYSAVMMFAEVLGPEVVKERLKVYATDLDNGALEQARLAVYSKREVESVPGDLLEKYFVRTGDSFTFAGDLRRTVIFGRHDLLTDAPISRVDLLLCRNTLMYFNKEVQDEVIRRFHYSVGSNGYLMLGKVEMLLSHGELFEPVDSKQRIFRKRPAQGLRSRLMAIVEGVATDDRLPEDRVAELAFARRRNPELALDANGMVAAVNDAAQRVFDIGTRHVGLPFQDLEISYRPVDLRSAIDRANNERAPVRIERIAIHRSPQVTEYFDVDVVPLELADERRLVGVLLSFTDVTGHQVVQTELEQIHRELETAYEELQSANEELETTNEELQSTIEELETTNEELQSTNEELETMNEELSSTNEELETINDELRERSNELDQVSSYIESILTSLDLAVIVVDRDLIIQVWNGRSYEMWGLRPEEAEGRSIVSLDIGLPLQDLTAAISRCLTNDETVGPFSVDAVSRLGRPLTCQVTVKPLAPVRALHGGALVLISADTRPA